MPNESINQAAPAAATQPEKPKTMEVPVDTLQTLLDRMEKMEAEQKLKDEQIAALNNTVNQTRLAEAKSALGKDTRARASFKILNGKVVVGWPEGRGEDKKNEWLFAPGSPTTPIGEIVKCRYYHPDGTKSEMVDQIVMAQSNEVAFARVLEDHGVSALMEFEDKSVWPTPIEIHKKFWNHQ